MEAFILVSRHGKVRLSKFYTGKYHSNNDQNQFIREISLLVLSRPETSSNVVDYREHKIVYNRYASLYFVLIVQNNINELLVLEKIHFFVEVLDKYFGNVCELDIIFNFHKAYFVLDEIFLAGDLQETSKSKVMKLITKIEDFATEEEDRVRQNITIKKMLS